MPKLKLRQDFGYLPKGSFREAIELDPGYALPYVELSNAYRVEGTYRVRRHTGEVSDKAKAAAK